jgi:hypothetical protein
MARDHDEKLYLPQGYLKVDHIRLAFRMFQSCIFYDSMHLSHGQPIFFFHQGYI